MIALPGRQRGFFTLPGGMGATAPSAPGGGDPHWADVVLLLPGGGTPSSSTIIDVSDSAHTVTAIAGAQYDTVSAPPGQTTSIYLAAAGLEIPDSPDFDFGSGDFTIETYFLQQSAFGVFPNIWNKKFAGNFSPVQLVYSAAAREIYFRASNNGSSYGAQVGPTPAPSFANGTWYHIAWCRSGTDFYAWLDGVSMGTASLSGALDVNTDAFTIGRAGNGGNLMNGNVSEFRITKGVARYTAPFTPPSIPFPTF